MNKSQKKKVRQTADGELTPEEVQHLRRCGFTITKSPSKRPTKRPLRRFAAWWETTPVEKFLEDIVFLLKNAALLDIINLVAGMTIIISLITWLATERQRRNAEIGRAWQVMSAASGKSSDLGRKEALKVLNSTPRRFPQFWLKWERQSLTGLALPGTFLPNLDIQSADLSYANFHKARLTDANFQNSFLYNTNFAGANLESANLQGTHLHGANFHSANLNWADLRGSWLAEANFQGVRFNWVNFQGASLVRSNFQGANFQGANFQDAWISPTSLTNRQIKSACNWEQAIYIPYFSHKPPRIIPLEPDNTNFIESLKKDIQSDPNELDPYEARNCDDHWGSPRE